MCMILFCDRLSIHFPFFFLDTSRDFLKDSMLNFLNLPAIVYSKGLCRELYCNFTNCNHLRSTQ